MVIPKTPQLRKLDAIRIGSWQRTFIRVMFSLALCVLARGIAPVSAISPHDMGGFLAATLLNIPDAVNGIKLTSIIVAFVGAVILLWLLRLVSGRRS